MRQTAWLAVDCDPGKLQKYVTDPLWAFEEKYDGKRLLIVKDGNGNLNATNRNGEPTDLPQEIAHSMDYLHKNTVLDGEWLHRRKEYVVFDMLWHSNVDCRGSDLKTRRTMLAAITNQILDPPIILAPQVTTTAGKMGMLERLYKESAEGIIMKRLDAKYVAGKNETMLRLKFKYRCDVVLQRRPNDNKASFEMFMFDNEGELIHAGSVSARHFYTELAVNQIKVGEIEYLYRTPDFKLYQPVLVRFRDDKNPEQCLTSQLVLGKKFVA